jgi:hypothetical protein
MKVTRWWGRVVADGYQSEIDERPTGDWDGMSGMMSAMCLVIIDFSIVVCAAEAGIAGHEVFPIYICSCLLWTGTGHGAGPWDWDRAETFRACPDSAGGLGVVDTGCCPVDGRLSWGSTKTLLINFPVLPFHPIPFPARLRNLKLVLRRRQRRPPHPAATNSHRPAR